MVYIFFNSVKKYNMPDSGVVTGLKIRDLIKGFLYFSACRRDLHHMCGSW